MNPPLLQQNARLFFSIPVLEIVLTNITQLASVAVQVALMQLSTIATNARSCEA